MLPLVLGGVALATIGYGVAKLFEEDKCEEYRYNKDDDSSSSYKELDDIRLAKRYDECDILPEAKEVIDGFENAKNELYRISLRELGTALDELINFGRELGMVLRLGDCQYNFTAVSDEVKTEFEKYAEILTMTQKYIDNNLDKLDTIIISSNDFSTYSDDDKEFITNLENIRNLVEVATNSNMTVDGCTIGREVKRAFGKLESLIS